MSARIWMLEGSSPELVRIEALLLACGERVGDSSPVPSGARVIHVADSRPAGRYATKTEILRASSTGQVIAELARLGVLPDSWERVYAPTDEMSPRGYIFRPTDSWAVCSRDARDTGVSGSSPDGRGLRAVMTLEGAMIPEELLPWAEVPA